MASHASSHAPASPARSRPIILLDLAAPPRDDRRFSGPARVFDSLPEFDDPDTAPVKG